jgi:hypothetical protein
MIARYPALYRDALGEEKTVIENDGKKLRMIVRGVEFTGTMFDDFEPSIIDDDPALASFRLRHFACIMVHYARAQSNATCLCRLCSGVRRWTDCFTCVWNLVDRDRMQEEV